MDLAAVNALDEHAFVAALGHVYEATPALAAVAWRSRPFADHEALVGAFAAAADALEPQERLALLQAHPELGAATAMAAASDAEQAAAGLRTGADAHDPRLKEIATNNRRYAERFGFPFIVAVQGLGLDDILAAQHRRLGHAGAVERAEAFTQVQRIARLRLDRAVTA